MSKTKKIVSFVLTIVMLMSVFAVVATASAASTEQAAAKADTDAQTAAASTLTSPSDFSWDNASVYFLLTDRFYNGNTSNDHSYGRSLNQSGSVTNGNSDAAAFHGGDFAGITQKINEGYFNNLGVNALWISAPYEQIHGYCIAGSGKSGSYPHYSYHGYYALDFSQTDANYGTAEEFETLVDTAHEHGLRVVLDIVMNHVGYNTIKDMSEYNFGTLKSGWENGYYNASLTNVTYHQYIDYNSNANDWARWWGTDWLRAGLAGYSEGSGDLQGSVSYLPDVRTESTKTVDIPQILKTKWSKEGTLAAKEAELNSYFSSTGKQRTTRNYLVFWLTQWVEKYGVDGFRCDTAKHVELESWKALKEQGVKSLETWRKNNPTKPGADWDEDFWMTGECFPHYLSYDSFYTQGGFDSMINFSYNSSGTFNANGSGVPAVGSINETYASYASQINTNDNFNVLTYISSHDTSLCRSNMIYQGSAFLLMPGGVQIYYGDETNRPLATSSVTLDDHALRSDMNWNSMNTAQLQHWQKVGTFRNNHVAVGAGSHTSLSATSGAAFARTYNKNGVNDKVVACIGANSNTNVTITLNGAFADGTVLKNTYDNTTATVSGGKVSFNSGANGTILLEEASQQPTTPSTDPTTTQATEPSSVKPPEPGQKILIGDANQDGKIDIQDATYIQLALVEMFTLNKTESIAADTDKNGSIDIRDTTMIQYYVAGGQFEDSYVGTYTETEPPVTQPTDPPTNPPTTPPTDPPTTAPTTPVGGTTVYFKNTSNWGTVNIHYWNNNNETTTWPGVPMEFVSGNVYKYTIPAGMTGVIFNNGSGEQTGDLTVPSSNDQMYTYSSNSWGPYSETPTTPTTPHGDTVKFTDSLGWGNVYAYFWGDGTTDLAGAWPGTAMTKIETNDFGQDVYSVSIPAGATSVVFTKGNDGPQTVDITDLGTYEGYYADGSQTNGKYNAIGWNS